MMNLIDNTFVCRSSDSSWEHISEMFNGIKNHRTLVEMIRIMKKYVLHDFYSSIQRFDNQ